MQITRQACESYQKCLQHFNFSFNCSMHFILLYMCGRLYIYNYSIKIVATDTAYNNVALNRPTFAISVFNHPPSGGDFPSSRAVDGNKDPDALKDDNSCFHSQMEINPWWAVDLGAVFTVVGVLFTNRGNGMGNVSVHALFCRVNF